MACSSRLNLATHVPDLLPADLMTNPEDPHQCSNDRPGSASRARAARLGNLIDVSHYLGSAVFRGSIALLKLGYAQRAAIGNKALEVAGALGEILAQD